MVTFRGNSVINGLQHVLRKDSHGKEKRINIPPYYSKITSLASNKLTVDTNTFQVKRSKKPIQNQKVKQKRGRRKKRRVEEGEEEKEEEEEEEVEEEEEDE